MNSICPCGSNDIFHDVRKGDMSCKRCGTVLEENGVVADVSFKEKMPFMAGHHNNGIYVKRY